ncbi:PilZ domain-containing protein [Cognatilysobacter bugurensis]|uniref:Cyclic di-GMP receptor atypical PilZ domain-containing protein n=1 Tax=Cognatilysobacter bugurensis TaxID=543356 RepID=A0A918WBZ2_9GAMM|nr:PilZ domain-containing protein [Lysobacter bugurensis]GHA90132.1 hypothetical protein GCM10007067_29860 [Lysobacter bugurensis]
MTPEQAADALFGDALTCVQHLPAAFVPAAPDAVAIASLCSRAEAFLQSVAVIEDSRSEDSEEFGPAALALNRIEARLDLLTALVARLAQRDSGDAWQSVRWSAAGAHLPLAGAATTGAGVFRVQPCDWLPEPLQLPATVIACDDSGAAWLRFEPLTPGLVLALERHLFRVHRREVAGRRGRHPGAA